MTTGRRYRLLATLSLLLALAAGCGVRPSVVITGGDAPAVPARGVGLFFVAGDHLGMVLRASAISGSAADALALLFAGPDPAERRQGYTTEIPSGTKLTALGIGPSSTTVTLAGGVTALSATAVDQIVCTVWGTLPGSGPTGGPAPVTLHGPDGSRGPLTCSLADCRVRPGGADGSVPDPARQLRCGDLPGSRPGGPGAVDPAGG